MIISIALVVTVISIIGCKEIKKSAVRGILGALATINILIVILAGSFTYVTRYKIHDLACSTSKDGTYLLLFQQVGDPDWPFGHTHARLILKEESGTIAKYPFDVANDGCVLDQENWSVNWEETCVKVIISGDEQPDELYTLYFDGKTDYNQLE